MVELRIGVLELTRIVDGQARKVRARLQDDQIRYNIDPLELQHVPLGPTLVYLRVCEVQAEDLPSVHCKGILGTRWRIYPPRDRLLTHWVVLSGQILLGHSFWSLESFCSVTLP